AEAAGRPSRPVAQTFPFLGLLRLAPREQRPHVGETPDHGGGRDHSRRHQVGAGAATLAAAEVAVGGRSAALARRHHVAINADAHGATRLHPFEPGRAEYAVEAFLFRLA